MASTELEKWVSEELMNLLGLDVDSVESISSYLLSIKSQDDLVDYVKELLTGSTNADKLNGPQKDFVRELMIRWQRFFIPENVTVYRKDNDNYNQSKAEKYKVTNVVKSSKNPFDMTTVENNLPDNSPSKNTKKKGSYISLYGKDGKLRSNAVILPGRNSCECQAQKHKLINNCLSCGRVVCEQEGSGPCLFCGTLVCTKEEKEILAKKNKKSDKLHNKLTRIPGAAALTKIKKDENTTGALEKAQAYKERLLKYDRTCVQRTKVIDDEADYYSTDSNIWLSEKERKYLKKKEAEVWEMKHGSRLNKKFTLDFAGRQVTEHTPDVLDAENDPETMAANFGTGFSESFTENQFSIEDNVEENFPGLVNPSIKGDLPTFIPTKHDTADKPLKNLWSGSNNRLQDKQLLAMSDPGMCLSMHQPWASLLVCGIKRDEGRSWFSSHRGRLWIAAAAKQPTKDEIEQVENQHRQHWEALQQISEMPEFPTEYPVGCLLGCVDVKDVMSQEQYVKSYPLGESGSAYVFVCENPHELALKFPVKGKHKVWKLDPKLHKTAKEALIY